MDGGTTFESRFQLGKALKEGGDMLRALEEGGGREIANEYYQRVCSPHRDPVNSTSLSRQPNAAT